MSSSASSSLAVYRRTLSEAAMREAIVAAVENRGGRCLYLPDSRGTAFGDWPDLTIVLGERLILVELKSIRRNLTAGQSEMFARLAECRRIEAFVVRPEPKSAEETGYTAFMDWLMGGAPSSR